MTLLFADGFDHYSHSGDEDQRKWDIMTGAYILETAARHQGTGKKGLYLDDSGNNYGIKTLPDRDTLIFGFAVILPISIYVPLDGFPTESLLRLFDGDNCQLGIRITSEFKLAVFNGESGLDLATTTNAISRLQWYYFEFKITISTGTIVMRVNETEWMNETGLDFQHSAQSGPIMNKFRLSCSRNNVRHYVDDLYVCDDQGTTCNDFLGDTVIETIRPDANGNYSQWTPSAGSNYENVDDLLDVDDDDTYNYTKTVGNRDSYTFGDLSENNVTVHAICVNSHYRKDDAGNKSVRPFTREASTDYDIGSEVALGDNYSADQVVLETNPATGVGWTVTGVNSLEVGIRLIS